MKKLKRKTKWMGLLLSLCMALSIVPLTAFAEEAESTEEVEITKRDSMVEHILNEENNWDISDELIMPGESFCIEPKYECTTSVGHFLRTVHTCYPFLFSAPAFALV